MNVNLTEIIIVAIATAGVGWIIKAVLDSVKSSINKILEDHNNERAKLNKEIELLKSTVTSLSEIMIYYIYKHNNLTNNERESLIEAINNYLEFNKNDRMLKLKEKILNDMYSKKGRKRNEKSE